MYKRKVKVLFLDSENTCASQMAEGYANVLGNDMLEARSAGIHARELLYDAVAIMQEDGVDISTQVPKVVTDEILQWADLIVTMSEYADRKCQVIPVHAQKKFWILPDLIRITGNNKEISAQFRIHRNEIKKRVMSIVGGLKMMGK